MGRRVGKTIDGVLTRQYVWEGRSRIVAELDGGGNLISRSLFALGVNSPDLLERAGQVYRVVKDQLGSPKLIINVSDASDVLMSAEYDEFGNVFGTGLGEVSFGFAGGLYDVDTGFVRFGVWDYDPQVGRWTGKDPLLWAGQQFNLYQYALGDPVNLVDSTGRSPTLVTAAVGAGVGALVGGGLAYLNGGNVAAGIAGGAVTGGLVGLTGGLSLPFQILLGAEAGVAGFATSAVVNVATGDPPPPATEMAGAALSGAAGPIVGSLTKPLGEPEGIGMIGNACRLMTNSIDSAVAASGAGEILVDQLE